MSEWQTIDTAPKDGTMILVWHKLTGTPKVLFWGFSDDADNDCWFAEATSGGYAYKAMPELTMSGWLTHWMPLPEPPKAA